MSRPTISTSEPDLSKFTPVLKSPRRPPVHSPPKRPLLHPSAIIHPISSQISNSHSRTFSVGPSTPKVPSTPRSAAFSSTKNRAKASFSKDLETSKSQQAKKELICELLEKALKELQACAYDSALQTTRRITREDSHSLRAIYMRAQCFIGLKDLPKAINELLLLIHSHPSYSKQAYIDLATCFVESGDISSAIRQITRGLLNFPNFLEGFISRGALYIKTHKWEKAAGDYLEAISMAPTYCSGYLGLADAFIGLKQNDKAEKVLDQALACPDSSAALIKRGKLLFESHHFSKALEDFESLISVEPSNAEAHYYKAFSLLGSDNLIDAAISLEQVIKYDITKQYTGAAIYNLGVIRIKQKDFYGAHFTFHRAAELGVEIEEQKVLNSYVDAILSLMRRKFKEGVGMLSRIIRNKHALMREYMWNCFACRGYAYSALGKHEEAVQDLSHAKTLQVLDHASEYNLLISLAIIEKDSEIAFEFLTKASELFVKNVEPLIYKAAIRFHNGLSSKSSEILNQSKELMDICVTLRENESELYFYRGIILYFCNRPIDAVYDLEQAIEKAEENVPGHFLARGLCSAQLLMCKEAIQDFSIVGKLNEKEIDAYIYRGRCYYLMKDFKLSIKDFEYVLSLDPINISAHRYLIAVQMLVSPFEQCLNSIELLARRVDPHETTRQKISLFFAHNKLPEAFQELALLNQSNFTLENKFDLEALKIYVNISANKSGHYFKHLIPLETLLNSKTDGNFCKKQQLFLLRGVIFLDMQEYQKARQEFYTVVSRRKKNECMEIGNAELIYNISLTYILEGNYKEALLKLNELIGFLDDRDHGRLLLLVALIKYVLKSPREGKKLLSEALKFDPDTLGAFIDEKPDLEVPILNGSSTFASNFKNFKVNIGESHPFYLKASISAPRPVMPNFEFEPEPKLAELFRVNTVKSRPETPWLNRVKGLIQFTDHIQDIESEEPSEDLGSLSSVSDIFGEDDLRKHKSQDFTYKQSDKKFSESSLSELIEEIEEANI